MAGPYNFVSQWKSARNLVLSAKTQAAWNTALVDASLTQRQRFDGAAVLELKPRVAATWPTPARAPRSPPTARSPASIRVRRIQGRAFALAGRVAVCVSDGHRHGGRRRLAICAYLRLRRDHAHRGADDVYLEDTEAVKYKCPDMCVNDVTLTISEIGAIMAEMSMVGTGRQTIAAIATLPALGAESYILGSDASLQFGRWLAGQLHRPAHEHDPQFENQLTVHKAPGGVCMHLRPQRQPKFSISRPSRPRTRTMSSPLCADTRRITS